MINSIEINRGLSPIEQVRQLERAGFEYVEGLPFPDGCQGTERFARALSRLCSYKSEHGRSNAIIGPYLDEAPMEPSLPISDHIGIYVRTEV